MLYYATYSAYDGKVVLPQLLETEDFLHFRLSTLNGPQVRNKGMALFPRRINGSYAMLSRQDNENIYLMFSDMLHFWYTKDLIIKPTYPWEFVQLGNCGSPIETESGWLVLSHGVGPMRRYAIGAYLLDRHNPAKVLGRLAEPLLAPNDIEREGYVPNVVYSCGGLVHQGRLILPYAIRYASSFAIAPLTWCQTNGAGLVAVSKPSANFVAAEPRLPTVDRPKPNRICRDYFLGTVTNDAKGTIMSAKYFIDDRRGPRETSMATHGSTQSGQQFNPVSWKELNTTRHRAIAANDLCC